MWIIAEGYEHIASRIHHLPEAKVEALSEMALPTFLYHISKHLSG